jgi:hypothetical protein
MAKRKKTDIVQFKLRIREALRRRLEAAAGAEERSLNSEIANRLENSFEQEKNSLMLEALLAPGAGLELVRAVGTILRSTGRDWNTPPKSHAVAEAIRKIVAVLSHELRPNENSFPDRNEKGSADQLAWLAVLVSRFNETFSPQVSEVFPPPSQWIPAAIVTPDVDSPQQGQVSSPSASRQHYPEQIREATDDSNTVAKPRGKIP